MTLLIQICLWEMDKMKVREESLKYGAARKREILRREEKIGRSFATLEKYLTDEYVNENKKHKVWFDLETKKLRLEVIIEHQTKGAIVRVYDLNLNGITDEGGKNTKYFLNLGKRRCKQGTITQLKVNNNDLVCTDKYILNECVSFFQNL